MQTGGSVVLMNNKPLITYLNNLSKDPICRSLDGMIEQLQKEVFLQEDPLSAQTRVIIESIARLIAIKETYVDENIINRICLTYNDDLLKVSLKRARS